MFTGQVLTTATLPVQAPHLGLTRNATIQPRRPLVLLDALRHVLLVNFLITMNANFAELAAQTSTVWTKTQNV
jgi:hypothetical protein